MSIQPNRVLGRIIEQVRSAPPATFAVHRVGSNGFTDPGEGEFLELYRVGGRDRERFATPVHLWAHALCAYLEARGKRDEFVGVAGYAMCEAIDAGELTRCLDSRLARLRQPLDLHPQSILRAYRMIDSPCRMSLLAEFATESLALFWEHGAGFRPVGQCLPAQLTRPVDAV